MISDSGKSAKNMAQKIAKQIIKEPYEILRNVPAQVVTPEVSKKNNNDLIKENENVASKAAHKINGLAKEEEMKSKRMLDALENEVKDIQRNKLYSELMLKIQNGEYVSLEDYPELTMEEKQVLKAQYEAVLMRIKAQENINEQVPQVSSKPSRKFMAGFKKGVQSAIENIPKKVDVIKPPSG